MKKYALLSEVTQIPDTLKPNHLSSLDGLRGISILMVLVHHYLLLYHNFFPDLIYIGPLGVDIFFVISGFLITTLCIKEKVNTGTISLKEFYIRRILRIIPVAYLYIATIVLLNFIFRLDILLSSFLYAAAFLMNFSFSRHKQFVWNLAHYWSLSTEEQFYIIFPFFIKNRFRIFVSAVMILPFLSPVLYSLEFFLKSPQFNILWAVTRYFEKLQGISIGCLFSILLFKGFLNFRKLKPIIIPIVIFTMFYLKYDPVESLHSSIVNLIISICIGILVTSYLQPQNNIVYKLLNFKPLKFVGKLSYSIYIWQQLFLSNDSRLPFSKTPYNFIFLIIVPLVSYFFYEKRFLKLKSRFKPKATPSDNGLYHAMVIHKQK